MAIILSKLFQSLLYLLDMFLESGQLGPQCAIWFNHFCKGFPRFSDVVVSVSSIVLGLLPKVMYAGAKKDQLPMQTYPE
jgi:hypothetical protein